jgi:4-amino-4-deoxy-L-arabinose transferase-like glycosyltransferase
MRGVQAHDMMYLETAIKREQSLLGSLLLYVRAHATEIFLVLLFLVAIPFRLQDIHQPSGILLADREYRAALISRSYYFDNAESIPAWRKRVARVSKEREGPLEPPIFEFLVSSVYRAVDGEHLWIARVLSSVFWLIGGAFLYLVARKVASVEAALAGTAYYLFVPLGIRASRSFQPDTLMIMMFLFSLWLILRHCDRPSRSRLLTAAAVTGFTLLIRPLVLFTLIGAFLSLAIYREGARRVTTSSHCWLFVILSFVPVVAYYGLYGVVAGFLHWKVGTSFMPHLFSSQVYWREWLLLGTSEVGLTPLLLALLGLTLVSRGVPKALLAGLWIGYFVFGLVFNFHIHTHGYYHLQLIPIIALSFAPIISLLVHRLSDVCRSWYRWVPITGALVLMFVFTAYEVHKGLAYPNFESITVLREVGGIVQHSTRTVYVARFYGRPLEYYGELSGLPWPQRITQGLYGRAGERERTIEQRFAALGFSPEYFIITDFNQFDRYHPDMKEYLSNHCRVVAQSKQYVIYGACA